MHEKATQHRDLADGDAVEPEASYEALDGPDLLDPLTEEHQHEQGTDDECAEFDACAEALRPGQAWDLTKGQIEAGFAEAHQPEQAGDRH